MIWILPAAAAAVFAVWCRPVSVDEAWSLVVARRMNRGDRLYRDVFYGAAPLAIWLQALVFRMSRSQGVVVRLLTVGYVLTQTAGAIVLVGDSPAARAMVVGLMIAFGGLHLSMHNHYGHLSSAAVLWAVVAAGHGRPEIAGFLVGLAVLGRYTVGLLATLALGIQVGVDDGWGSAVWLISVAAIPVLAAVMTRPSSVSWFLRRAVRNKTRYVTTGRTHPVAWIRERSWRRTDTVVVQAAFIGAMLLVVAAPVATVWAAAADAGAFALALVGASVVSPRFDGSHAVAAVPLTAPALAMALDGGAVAAWLGLVAGIAAVAGLAARWSLTRRVAVRRDLPSLRHLPVTKLAGGVWPDETADLPEEVFVLRMDAAMVYACGGVVNPTPFDYPAASTFGATGQQLVLDRFEHGMAACDGWRNPAHPLAPVELLQGLAQHAGRATPLGRVVQTSHRESERRAGDQPR